MGGRAYKVAVIDDKLYIPISNRVDVVDISSTREPSLISQNRVSELNSMSHLYKLKEGLLSIPSDDLVHFELSDEDAPTYNFSVDTDQTLYNSVVADDTLPSGITLVEGSHINFAPYAMGRLFQPPLAGCNSLQLQ